MENVIKDIVSDSFADKSYSKAIKAIRVYRSEAIDVFPLASMLTTARRAATIQRFFRII
jgi:hypothetical protein